MSFSPDFSNPDAVVAPRAAVIDVGSNTIKALVATIDPDSGAMEVLMDASRPVRLLQSGAGARRIDPATCKAAVAAIGELYRECRKFRPLRYELCVATSAVRDAHNAQQLIREVEQNCGLVLEVLSGQQEADVIAHGLMHDPAVAATVGRSFSFFDLGGGSLEFGTVDDGRLRARTSLKLGAVRLTQRFFKDNQAPIDPDAAALLRAHVRDTLRARLRFERHSALIGTGGGVFVAKALIDPSAKWLTIEAIDALYATLSPLPTAQRIQLFPDLPANRADILPAALLTFSELLHFCGTDRFLHSHSNLRYGLAHQWLFPPVFFG